MSVILCRQKAEKPFFYDKLNINIYSEQELSYLIYTFPLLALDSLLSDDLLKWILDELKMKELGEKLFQYVRGGESIENQLLLILSESNYYSFNEIREFQNRLLLYRKMSRAEKLQSTGKVLAESGRYLPALSEYRSACEAFDTEILKCTEEKEKTELLSAKAEVYCDMAVLCLYMFDEDRALEYLLKSELTSYNKRAVRIRYLVTKTGDISDREKAEYDKEKQLAIDRVAECPERIKLEEIFSAEEALALDQAGEQIKIWKNQYRRMI